MPIEIEKARGAKLEPSSSSWNEDGVILYHLGVGAGLEKPTDPKELQYTYESALKVLPTFAVVPTFRAIAGLGSIPGVSINFAMVLHGEQDIEIHRPIPTAATIESTGCIEGLYDKGKAALIVLRVDSFLRSQSASDVRVNGELLFTNRYSIFARGEGGFGGEAGPKAGNEAPTRAADHVVESKTLPNQALLYRLSGDKNPLHADPNFAAFGGFDRPILHGLCSYGITCKAVVDTMLDGDVNQVARYQARFAGVVFPGETIVTSMWREGNQILVSASSKERGTPVISNCALTLRA